MALGCACAEVGRHVHPRDAFQVADRAVHHQAAALRRLHDVVEQVVADDRAAFLLAEQIHHQHVARLQHVDRRPGCSCAACPAAFAFALTTPSRSGRSGMNCTVKARPTSFLPGCRTRKPSAYWLRKPCPGQDREDLLRGQPARALDQRVGHLRPAVGEPLERVLRGVLDQLLLVSVKSWASETTGASTADARPRATRCVKHHHGCPSARSAACRGIAATRVAERPRIRGLRILTHSVSAACSIALRIAHVVDLAGEPAAARILVAGSRRARGPDRSRGDAPGRARADTSAAPARASRRTCPPGPRPGTPRCSRRTACGRSTLRKCT